MWYKKSTSPNLFLVKTAWFSFSLHDVLGFRLPALSHELSYLARCCPAHLFHHPPSPTAGIVAGQTTGVAKNTTIFSVRVLDEMGSGTIATLVDGINHVANSNLTNRIASMSLGGGKADALNDAVEAAVKAGVLVIVAAGNEASPACEVSPGKPCAAACGCGARNRTQPSPAQTDRVP